MSLCADAAAAGAGAAAADDGAYDADGGAADGGAAADDGAADDGDDGAAVSYRLTVAIGSASSLCGTGCAAFRHSA